MTALRNLQISYGDLILSSITIVIHVCYSYFQHIRLRRCRRHYRPSLSSSPLSLLLDTRRNLYNFWWGFEPLFILYQFFIFALWDIFLNISSPSYSPSIGWYNEIKDKNPKSKITSLSNWQLSCLLCDWAFLLLFFILLFAIPNIESKRSFEFLIIFVLFYSAFIFYSYLGVFHVGTSIISVDVILTDKLQFELCSFPTLYVSSFFFFFTTVISRLFFRLFKN